jgi:hypothetical protein
MRSMLLLCFMLISLQATLAQKIDWSQSKKWRLFHIVDDNAFSYPLDTLINFDSIALDDTKMRAFLSHAQAWPVDKYSLWMGLYVATCELSDDQPRKVDISVFGGFFYDEQTKRYYEVPSEIRNEWLEFLSHHRQALEKKLSKIELN